MGTVQQALNPSKIVEKFNLSMKKLVDEQIFLFAMGFDVTTMKIQKAAEAQKKLNAETQSLNPEAQKNLNAEVAKGASLANKLSGAFGMAKSALNNLKIIAEVAVLPAAKEQAAEDLFKIKVGNPEVGTSMFEKIKQDALKAGMDVNASLNNALSFMSMTQNSDQIAMLNGFADRLSKLSPGGKSSGDAAAAIMSAMNGDTSLLTKNFNIPKPDLGQFSAEIAASKGNFDAFLVSMDQLLQKSGITQEALGTMMDSPINKWQMLLGNVNNSFTQIGGGALDSLVPILDMLNAAFQAGTFDPFINALSIGLSLIAQGFLWVAEAIPPAWEFIKAAIVGVGNTIWNLITIFFGLMPVIAFVGTLLAVLYASFNLGKISAFALASAQSALAAVTNMLAGAQRMLNMVLKANPFMLVISLIIAIIAAIGTWQVVTMGIKKVFSNAFGFIMDIAETAVNFVIGVINGLIKGVNAVSGFFANLLGIEANQIAEIEFRADYSQIKEQGQDFIENFSMDDFNKKFMPDKNAAQEDLLQGWNMGKTGKNTPYTEMGSPPPAAVSAMTPMAPKTPAMPSAPMPVAPMGGSIDSIGKVDKSVDVASEDLKVMRDLAEVNAISNMITLTPTVQMTTGDINSGADLDTIMSKINRTLEEQFVSSAEGVYL